MLAPNSPLLTWLLLIFDESDSSSNRSYREVIDIMLGSPVDLSHKLTHQQVQVCPGHPEFSCCPVASIDADGSSVHAISLGSHTGTHIDAPSHFITGAKSIDQLPLSLFIGPALVINLTYKEARQKITWDDLASHSEHMKEGIILLLYTGWSENWCTPEYLDHPYLDGHAAERIVAKGIRVIGVDTCSPDEHKSEQVEGEESFAAHKIILGAGGVIAENLTNLKALRGPNVVVSLVPLLLDGSDGSPIRALGWNGS